MCDSRLLARLVQMRVLPRRVGPVKRKSLHGDRVCRLLPERRAAFGQLSAAGRDFLFAPLRDAYRQNDMPRLNGSLRLPGPLPAARIDQLMLSFLPISLPLQRQLATDTKMFWDAARRNTTMSAGKEKEEERRRRRRRRGGGGDTPLKQN
ncbi:hypothetical protein EYF80_023132 [Liparis tanakae]|uniref:Uncharacterized protein n=1 Tax=Liparis tanakae TaxID=230148 RepID=A0A4Z2HL70_9TELE|nr:hypothetical protein EYF80_023132 [Liparis tanakae]